MSILLIIIISYLIGSIQSGILIGKIIYKTDVRQFGSKSSGATNIQRTIGLKPGIFVLVLDILKGFLPILFIEIFTEENILGVMSCIFLVLGHCYPVFHKFKGGKGVATGFGSVVVLLPYIALGIPIALPIIYKTRYVSLGAILGCIISIFLIILFVALELLPSENLMILFVPLLIIYKHKQNIIRLIQKKENKIFS
ncbi:MAG: glycerol-3-phosphate 1-O-acyltransferase PlsY [SAR202 cluster bacterium]|nr:glycerol-3-phosphate 1-O-acyltransferase PlsY [SAR202 cluster bacterium]MQG24345.1 glycerol-3-phosphate 1-O-acyltransferase PlsY [SAR202 cluster bacterium]MQG42871.1 glycerol-3-phosphate 1-O-acyltransferase PlsY [SAR202 cluster bacterium]|tara:strand:- start:108 stop:698 length:591 start_codon:yes stop_codon:yes gene_type:complete